MSMKLPATHRRDALVRSGGKQRVREPDLAVLLDQHAIGHGGIQGGRIRKRAHGLGTHHGE